MCKHMTEKFSEGLVKKGNFSNRMRLRKMSIIFGKEELKKFRKEIYDQKTTSERSVLLVLPMVRILIGLTIPYENPYHEGNH